MTGFRVSDSESSPSHSRDKVELERAQGYEVDGRWADYPIVALSVVVEIYKRFTYPLLFVTSEGLNGEISARGSVGPAQ
ncbi:hypothetical protein [Nocardia asiatica]|uniref:hypothetical protein n=1 Tax=Nocardia asiatica TaxID=209252 RepID=UPI003EDF01D7